MSQRRLLYVINVKNAFVYILDVSKTSFARYVNVSKMSFVRYGCFKGVFCTLWMFKEVFCMLWMSQRRLLQVMNVSKTSFVYILDVSKTSFARYVNVSKMSFVRYGCFKGVFVRNESVSKKSFCSLEIDIWCLQLFWWCFELKGV